MGYTSCFLPLLSFKKRDRNTSLCFEISLFVIGNGEMALIDLGDSIFLNPWGWCLHRGGRMLAFRGYRSIVSLFKEKEMMKNEEMYVHEKGRPL